MKILQLEMKGILNNFSYIIICEKTNKGIIIDPGILGIFKSIRLKKIISFIKKHNIKIQYIINTHHHNDHTNGNNYLVKHTGAEVLSYINGLRENDIIECGSLKIKVFETPGHTSDGITLYINKNLFTGDSLFVGDSGMTLSKDSNRFDLGSSLRKLIKLCPPETIIWSGHNYGSTKTSTLANERQTNKNSEEYKLQSVSYKN